MNTPEFHKANIDWADRILSHSPYIMPNGRNSHDVAREVRAQSIDTLEDLALDGRYNAFGQLVEWPAKPY